MPKANHKNVSRDLKDNIYNGIIVNLAVVKQLVIDKIETSYDQMLNVIRFHRSSFMKPCDYLSDFMETMYEMEWIYKDRDSVKFSYPNEENFPWTSDLEPIKIMVEGVARGRYPHVELTKEDAKKIGITKKELKGFTFRVRGVTFYLVLRTPIVKGKMMEYSIQERLYPLSKSGPINIFDGIDDFVSEKMDEITDSVSNKAFNDTRKKFGG